MQQNKTPQPSYPVAEAPRFSRQIINLKLCWKGVFSQGTEPTLVTKGAKNTTIEQKGF